MPETVEIKRSDSDNQPAAEVQKKSRIELWIGIITTVITILLTVYNTYTKSRIDDTERRLREIEVGIKEKAQELEEAKERVARYNWIRGLLSDLDESNPKKRSFTLNLIRLALTQDEAEQMFAGFQASSDKALQASGQDGMFSIQNEPIARLATQLNAPSEDISKNAVKTLKERYGTSSTAISFVLRLFNNDIIDSLSPNGVINALDFLKSTDPLVWNREQIYAARKAILLVQAKGIISRTRNNLDEFETFLKQTQPVE